MKKVGLAFAWLGWLFCIAIPVALPVAFAKWHYVSCVLGFDHTYLWQSLVGCVVFVLVLGHALMAMFWHSLQERRVEKTAPERNVMSLDDDEVSLLRKFLAEQFGGNLRLETDYRFPNGFRSDLVAIHGRGRYPIMCFEIVSGEDENRIHNAVRELRFVAEPFVDITRCFILKKLNGGSYQLLKVRGSSTQVVGTFTRELRDEIEYAADRKVSDVKRSRLRFPILFLLLVVTPIIEIVAILTHIKFAISGTVSTLLVFWIGAFMGVFGVGIKGYEPKVSDLMKD